MCGNFWAFNGATGTIAWSFALGYGNTIPRALSMSADGALLYASNAYYNYPVMYGQLLAINASTGATAWVTGTGGRTYGGPVVSPSGIIYVGPSDYPGGNFTGVNGTTGAVVWGGGPIAISVSTPALGPDGTLYSSNSISGGAFLIAGASAAGGVGWETGPAPSGYTWGAPAVGRDGTVYMGHPDSGVIYAFDGATGAVRWSYATGAKVSGSAAIAGDGTVLIGSENKTLYAFLAVTPSPSPSPSLSPSRTLTQSPTQAGSASQTVTGSLTRTLTPTGTVTPSPTETLSQMLSPSVTQSLTSSGSGTPSQSGSRSNTVTGSLTQTRSGSGTPSLTQSPSPTQSSSTTATLTPSQSQTGCVTPSQTPSQSISQSSSQTQTRSATMTQSQSPSATGSPTLTPSQSISRSSSQTQTRSATATLTPSETQSITPSGTGSASQSQSDSQTTSPSQSQSLTPSPTVSPSQTQSLTLSQSQTTSPSESATPSGTQSASQSTTITRSATATPSTSASPSPTATPSTSLTPSQSQSQSPSQAQTVSQTQTPSASLRPVALILSPRTPVTPDAARGAPASGSPVAPRLALSDSTAPVTVDLEISRCLAPGLIDLRAVCWTSSIGEQPAAAQPPSLFTQVSFASSGTAEAVGVACVLSSTGVVAFPPLGLSVVVGAAFGTSGGLGHLGCEVFSGAGASLARETLLLSVTPTRWPLWADAIVVLTDAAKLHRLAGGGISLLLRSALAGVTLNATDALAAACASPSRAHGTCDLADAMLDPVLVLAAAQAVWDFYAVPPTQPSPPFSLTLTGAAWLVFRAPANGTFFPDTAAFFGDAVGAIRATSSDGAWALVETPAVSAVCDTAGSTQDCGYATFTLRNGAPGVPANASALAAAAATRGSSFAFGGSVVGRRTAAASTVRPRPSAGRRCSARLSA